MYRLKNLFVAIIVLLIFCFCTTLLFAQEQAKTAIDKPNFQDPRLLIVKIYPDGKLALNGLEINGMACLRGQLLEIFEARFSNGVYTDEMQDRNDVPETERVAKSVYILAASNLSSENVAAVVKVVKLAGASPIKMLTDVSYQKLLDKPPSPPEPRITTVKSKVKILGKKPKSQ